MKEEFREVVGYEGLYTVSNKGRVYSVRKEKIMLLGKRGGCRYVGLSNNNTFELCDVHKLVAGAFMTEYSDDLIVEHIDMNKKNNRISNLRLATD